MAVLGGRNESCDVKHDDILAKSERALASIPLKANAPQVGPRLAAQPQFLRVNGHEALKTYLKMLGSELHEWLVAIFVDDDFRLLGLECMGRGSISYVPVDFGRIIARGRGLKASAFILAHNHPSGDPTPSQSDVTTTCRLAHIAQDCDLPMLMHAVVTDCGVREVGWW